MCFFTLEFKSSKQNETKRISRINGTRIHTHRDTPCGCQTHENTKTEIPNKRKENNTKTINIHVYPFSYSSYNSCCTAVWASRRATKQTSRLFIYRFIINSLFYYVEVFAVHMYCIHTYIFISNQNGASLASSYDGWSSIFRMDFEVFNFIYLFHVFLPSFSFVIAWNACRAKNMHNIFTPFFSLSRFRKQIDLSELLITSLIFVEAFYIVQVFMPDLAFVRVNSCIFFYRNSNRISNKWVKFQTYQNGRKIWLLVSFDRLLLQWNRWPL